MKALLLYAVERPLGAEIMLHLAIFLALSQAGLPHAECVAFEVWKGGDDGMTNRIYDQIDVYNRAWSRCNEGRHCSKKILLIPTHVKSIEVDSRELISVPIEVYADKIDPVSLERKFSVECDLTQNDCADRIFAKLAPPSPS